MPQPTTEKKNMNIVIKAILIYVASIIIALFTASWFGDLYDGLFNPDRRVNLLSFDFGNALEGFVYGYILFLALLVSIFIKNKKSQLYIWLIGNAFFLLTFITGGAWKEFFVLLVVSAIGYLIGHGINAIKSQQHNHKPPV